MNTFRLGKLTPPRKTAFGSWPSSTGGVTRLEVIAVLAAVALLLAVVLPALAASRERSQKLFCFANLRGVGQALQQWGTEHDNRVSWRVPWCEGGTMPVSTPACSGAQPSWMTQGLFNNPWFQFYWLSNELRTPKVLVCPSDPRKHAANNWGNSPDGFLHPAYLNASVSYFVGLDILPEFQNILVSGDRNVRFMYGSAACSSLVRANASLELILLLPGGVPSPGINDQFHGPAGNYLFTDGKVEEVSSADFVKRLLANEPLDDNSTQHYLVPTN